MVELQDGLSAMMDADPPQAVNDIITFVKTRKTEQVRHMHSWLCVCMCVCVY